MAEGRTVKVERSRARGRVASNTLTVRTAAIQSRTEFCLGPQTRAPKPIEQRIEYPPFRSVRFFEASAKSD